MSLQENTSIYSHVVNELYKHANLDVIDEYFAPDSGS